MQGNFEPFHHLNGVLQRLFRPVGREFVSLGEVFEIGNRYASPDELLEDCRDQYTRCLLVLRVAVAGDDLALAEGGVDEGGSANHLVALLRWLLPMLIDCVEADGHLFDFDVFKAVRHRNDGAVVEADGPFRICD